LILGAGLIADFHPLHVDETFARNSRYGGRILHGVMTSAIMGGVVGTHFSGSALAYLEHAARFLAPVRIGDTLRTSWRITEITPKPAQIAGIVTLTGECRNQETVLVAEANGKMLVALRAYFKSAQ